MNLMHTAVPRVLRSFSFTSRIHIPIFSSSVINKRTLATSSNTQKEEEVEDVLYKRCELECRGVDPAVLKSYSIFTQRAARELGITAGESITPAKAHKRRWTVLKSKFVHAKHLAQYEVRTYYHTMNFLRMTGSTADTFLEYVQRNLPEGVAMKVTKVRLERLPEHLKTPPDMLEPELPEESPPDADGDFAEESHSPNKNV